MYNRPEQVLELYDLEIKSVAKGRRAYICETNCGTKILKEYKGSMERAEFLAKMLDFLKEYPLRVETIVRTKENEPVAKDTDDTRYMLCGTFEGVECDTKSRDHILLGVKELARLHLASREYQGDIPEFVKSKPDAPLWLYEKHNRELNKVKNYIRTKKKKNEFEVRFMEQYEYFMEKAKEVTNLLAMQKIDADLVGFCHGDYNQHNLLFEKQGAAIVRFDAFSYQVQVSDLANFMRKMLEKQNWNCGLALDMIKAYDKERKLSEEEIRLLYLYLAYPEKFWKIANHYYNSHKAWVSGRDIEKLGKVVEQERARSEFLEMLFRLARVNMRESM